MNPDIKNKIKIFSESKLFKIVLYSLGILIIAGLIFQAGVFVGFHKALFGRDWGDNYSKNFGPMHRGRIMIGGDFANLPNAHGAIGKIIKIELPTMIVLDKDNTEKVVLISEDTNIRLMRDNVSKDTLVVGNFVVVIGSPNASGQIEAKLIRVFPSPLENSDSIFTIPVIPSKQ